MPAFICLKYSWVTSLMVGSDSFMVNCCAPAGTRRKNAGRQDAGSGKPLRIVVSLDPSSLIFCCIQPLASRYLTPISEMSGM